MTRTACDGGARRLPVAPFVPNQNYAFRWPGGIGEPTLGTMVSRHPVLRLREIEHGLGAFAEEVEDHLETKPINLLWWQQELRAVIAELEDGKWQPTAPANRSAGPR